jgi:hypothetical protein
VTCPGECTGQPANFCGTDCVCISVGGGLRQCVVTGTCSADPCEGAGSTPCAAGCECVGTGLNSRCVFQGTCANAPCEGAGSTPCATGCTCVGLGGASRCVATSS